MASSLRIQRPLALVGLALLVSLLPPTSSRAEDCAERQFNSTFELIQDAIFEKRGCNDQLCHGNTASDYNGNLDLRPEVAYQNLIDVPASSVTGIRRIFAGEKIRSLLFLNVAAKTYPDEFTAPLRAMPLNLPALTPDEIELLRLWIEAGAPEQGTVHGTEFFDPCLPPPQPVAIKPLDPPAPGTGLQLRMPRWTLAPHSEDEVCFASYYDVTDQVPVQFRSPDGKYFRYKRNEVRQDNLSHHLIVNVYEGSSGPSDPEWGSFECQNGAKDGESCDPTDPNSCGADGICATEPVSSVACIGIGPGDSGVGLQTAPLSGLQKTAGTFEYAPDVYREAPLKGMILWNSHAFNLTDTEGKLDAWLNFEFAPPEEQKIPVVQIFNADEIFKTDAAPFSTDEPCSHHVLPGGAHLFELSSHGHQRMKRWRTFLGAFRCESGPAAEQACSPLGYDFNSPDVCQGARCVSVVKKRVGDCDQSGGVTVDEVIFSVNLALGKGKFNDCRQADGNGDRTITVDEVITSVTAALQGVPQPEERDPQESLLYVSSIYNDPVVLRFEPELVMPGRVAPADERSLTFCALYDNGFTDPSKVKLASTSPQPPVSFPGIGGPCSSDARMCATGKVGQACTGRSQTARDRSCDTATGSGDGSCDACPLKGGVTTEDEMFLLLGQYYVPSSATTD